jgi:CDP-glucose 4,6-dehydratase
LGGLGEKMNSDLHLIQFFKGKKVLVTGHTGFKGSWLTQILIHWGAEVSGISLPPHTDPNMFEVLKLEKSIHNYFVDIRHLEELQEVFSKQQPEIVFHLAAQAIVKTSYDDPILTHETNIIGTANILQCIRKTSSVKSAVIITSDKVYDNVEWVYPYREIDKLGGPDPYSASKAAADIVAQSFIKSFLMEDSSPAVAITRAGNVVGGGDWSSYRIVPDIIRAIYEDNKSVVLRSPESIRPWQHVLEPLSGYLLLAKKLFDGDRSLISPWNFGPKDENFVTVLDIVKNGINILKKGSYEIAPHKTFHKATLLKLDIAKAKALLNWHPRIGLKETLDFTFGWYKNYYEKLSSPVEYTNRQITEFFSG